MNSFAVSLIRTYTPLLVGMLLTWLASSLHIVIDPSSQAGLVALCVTVLTAAYYLLVRLVERRMPSFGVLLGAVKQPTYSAARGTTANARWSDEAVTAALNSSDDVKPA